MEKPIENMKNLAYSRIFEREKLTHVVANGQKYVILKEVDEDLPSELRPKYVSTKQKP